MPLSLDLCTDEDLPRWTEIIFAAFAQEHIYIDALFPHHDTPSGLAAAVSRFTSTRNSNPIARFLKITDSTTGEIIGQGKWDIHETKPDEVALDGDFWDNEEDKTYAQQMFETYLIPRRRVLREAKGPVLGGWVCVIEDLCSRD